MSINIVFNVLKMTRDCFNLKIKNNISANWNLLRSVTWHRYKQHKLCAFRWGDADITSAKLKNHFQVCLKEKIGLFSNWNYYAIRQTLSNTYLKNIIIGKLRIRKWFVVFASGASWIVDISAWKGWFRNKQGFIFLYFLKLHKLIIYQLIRHSLAFHSV